MKTPLLGMIMAGGIGKRLGYVSKGLLEDTSGKSIVMGLLKVLTKAGLTSIINANTPKEYDSFNVPVIPDNYTDCGPLAGIEAGLRIAKEQGYAGIVTVAADMPCLTPEIILSLQKAFHKSSAPVVYAETGLGEMQKSHPICSAVGVELIEDVQDALQNNRLRIGTFWEESGGEAVHFLDKKAFMNINTHSDLLMWHENQGR